MKTTHYLLAITLLFSSQVLNAQEEEAPKWALLGYGGIGYGIVENNNAPNYNLNSNNGSLLLNYGFSDKLGLATGIGLNELTGNGFNANGNFYHERTLLQVPLIFTLNSEVAEGFSITGAMGLLAQNIVKDQFTFLNETQNDVYEGWNLGAQFSLGFLFTVLDDIKAGIHYQGQTDFGTFDSGNNEQKLSALNSVGLIFMFGI